MFKVTDEEILDLALYTLFLEGFLYGLYTGIFTIYLQYKASLNKDTDKTKNIIFYSMCALYVASASVFVCDITYCIFQNQYVNLDPFDPNNSIYKPNVWMFPIFMAQTTLFACCDFIAQFILIYRCWIVWGRDIRIVIIPSILAFAFLGIWILGSGSTPQDMATFGLPYRMTLTGISLSLTVNSFVTGLMVFKIFQVFRQVKATSDDKILNATGGSKLRRIIWVIIESAMVLFSIQLARLIAFILWELPGASRIYSIIVVTHQMLNGITPTIILVRTSMGLSFHDEKSMEEPAVGSLRFASDHPNSVLETGSVSIVGRDDDGIDSVQRSNDIDVMER